MEKLTNLVDLLRHRTLSQPDQVAYTFLADDNEKLQLTYSGLDRRARSVAARLQRLGLVDERALLVYPPGLEYIVAFFGCLYAGVIAVPVYAPHRARFERSSNRLRTITEDARPLAVLTTTTLIEPAETMFAANAGARSLHWLATDEENEAWADEWQMPSLNCEALAFIQYTSGSTAAPKGVMLTHGNLLHNLKLMDEQFKLPAMTPGVIWLPPYHDMGLIGGILEALYACCPVVLMSPVSFLQRPLRWLEAITSYRAVISGGPNFAYELCARRVTSEQKAALDLSSWEIAFVGAEPIRVETLERFSRAFEACGFRREAFYPCYGLAEATLMVSGSNRADQYLAKEFQIAAVQPHDITTSDDTGQVRRLVSCGRPLGGQRLLIVDPETSMLRGPGEIGEIWVAGPSIAPSYWNRAEETQATFGAYLKPSLEGPFLRTGDLGLLDDGELFVTGRLKDLIIIRGRNHYPQDIEQTVERSHESLRAGCGAAFSIEFDNEERLVVVQEVERHFRRFNTQAVLAAIRQAVTEEHEVQVYAIVLIKTGTIRKTSSGKIQRYACRAAFLASALDVVAGDNLLESSDRGEDERLTRDAVLSLEPTEQHSTLQLYLQRRLERLLHLNPQQFDPALPISTLGLDSLTTIDLQHEIERDLDVVIPLSVLFKAPSVIELANEILLALAKPVCAGSSVARTTLRLAGQLPTSYGQQSMFYLQQLAPENTAYNITRAVRIPMALDIAALHRALQELVNRHAILRTTFVLSGGECVQRVQSHANVCFEHDDSSTWKETELHARIAEEAERPFDLEHGPLFRVHLFTQSEHEHFLVMSLHHIVADLWSVAVLVSELGALFQGFSSSTPVMLAPPALQYADYVDWQRDQMAGPEGDRLWSYWQTQLTGELPTLNLPADRPRPMVQSYRGHSHSAVVEQKVVQGLRALSEEREVTLYTTLLASFQILLYRYTNQTDILVGSPVAGRSRARFRDLVGYFANPLAMRANLSGNPTFNSFLEQTRGTVLAALDHQDYPFALLTERLKPSRQPGRSPIFEAMFVMQGGLATQLANLSRFAAGEAGVTMRVGDLQLESLPIKSTTSQFDLTLSVAEDDDHLRVTLECRSDLFDAPSSLQMLDNFQTLLKSIVAHPEQQIADLPLLTTAERQRLTVELNDTAVAYDKNLCLHHLFEAQVKLRPNAIALIAGGESFSYSELNAHANRIANYLRKRKYGIETLVGICMDRSVKMVAALLGILKAGCAYVPLEPSYPEARLALLIEDTKTPLVLTHKHLVSKLPASGPLLVSLEEEPDIETGTDDGDPAVEIDPENLAYVIYTSGSTGRPKGVAITHANVVALLMWAQLTFTLKQLSGVLATTSISFDLSVFEIMAPLSKGGTVILAGDALQLPTLPNGIQITLINTVPSVIAEFLRIGQLPRSALVINLAGEPLPGQLARQLYEQESVQQVNNLYGPSEDTTYSTHSVVPRGGDHTPSIGGPISNKQIYLLDAQLEPVPPGVTGELYIGGAGLARGYLFRPELTAERFIPNPFGQAGTRLYETGDLARYRQDGEIEFLGRVDNQVKWHGFRIELSEIEAVLRQHPRIMESAVVLREFVSDDRRLVAYIVPESGPALPPATELRRFLQAHLPEYMVPALFVPLDALPRTAHGKLDRRALPIPDQEHLFVGNEYVEPRTQLEKELASIWSELLGFDSAGIHDNFFDLGGHSLLATRLVSRVRDAFQVTVTVRSFFETPTIAGLATYIEMLRWSSQAKPASVTGEGREEGRL